MRAPFTLSKSELGTSDFAGAGAEREIKINKPESQKSEVAESDRSRFSALIKYCTPPAVLTDRPASVKELATYAKKGTWTRQDVGFVRAAGIGWYRFVGLPVTVACRYLEWVAQRPGRVVTLAILFALFSLSTPGQWLLS